ncbi:MAG: hypothetical protein J7M25_18715 [Deltaproteobacteria bacterium]|nr:hypothetical protein [Deltaproteobacteria bacterium]
MFRRTTLAVIAIAAAMSVAACGKKSSDSKSESDKTSAAKSTKHKAATQTAAQKNHRAARQNPARPAARPVVMPRPKPGEAIPKGGSGKAYTLALHIKAGQVFDLTFTSKQKIHQTVMGKKQDMDQVMGMTYSMSVKNMQSNGTADMVIAYTAIQFHQKSVAMTIDYDSTKGQVPNNPMAKVFAALKGQTFKMTITKQGHVTKIKGMSAIVDRMLAALQLPEGPAKKAVEKRIRKQFSDEAVRSSMENMLDFYPEGPVKVGGSWTKTKLYNLGMALALINRYTLDKVHHGVAFLTVTSTVTSVPGSSMPFGAKGSLTYKLSGIQTGTMELPLATGLATKAVLKQNMSGTVTMKQTPTSPGISWPISLSSDIILAAAKK